jgi:hypothetical protein
MIVCVRYKYVKIIWNCISEETKQLENNENRVSQGVEQISGEEIQELNVLLPEHGTNMEEEISELYKVRDISSVVC